MKGAEKLQRGQSGMFEIKKEQPNQPTSF